MPVSMLLVKAMANSVYDDMSKGDHNVKPFSVSTGWFSRFTEMYFS
jgi:hypothetical protein